jgi:hypothetical protein
MTTKVNVYVTIDGAVILQKISVCDLIIVFISQ